MLMQRAFTSLVAAFAIGWLAGGSCVVATCFEDCDPCIQQCKCKTSKCSTTQAAYQATHALIAFEHTETTSPNAHQRTFTNIAGLSVQRAGGPAQPGTDDVVRFARGVLLVNRPLFRLDPNELTLLQALHCESGTLAQFQRGHEDRATDLITFFFDPRGNLMQITHDARN